MPEQGTRKIGMGKLVVMMLMLLDEQPDSIDALLSGMDLEIIEELGRETRKLHDIAKQTWLKKKKQQ